ncbi:MAG: 3'-phosphoesterase [Candidatus Thermoplasmatota archaeon]|nr:3'-phosphoesterase [Candidatus Thermoplasmatota archaeon]
MRFVVQEHDASSHHYDLRLEMDDVAKSWAVPKQMPEEQGEKRLAIQTADHDVDYMDFEGTIPEGEYGAGEVSIWDRGTYELLKREDDEIKFELHGQRLRGRYVLVLFRKAGDDGWLIIKE